MPFFIECKSTANLSILQVHALRKKLHLLITAFTGDSATLSCIVRCCCRFYYCAGDLFNFLMVYPYQDIDCVVFSD